jgi:hypothetical protein
MYLHTAEPKTADLFIGRLREIEKINIRKANEGELEHMRQTIFLSDGITEDVMAEVKQRLDAGYRSGSEGEWWEKQTWNI